MPGEFIRTNEVDLFFNFLNHNQKNVKIDNPVLS